MSNSGHFLSESVCSIYTACLHFCHQSCCITLFNLKQYVFELLILANKLLYLDCFYANVLYKSNNINNKLTLSIGQMYLLSFFLEKLFRSVYMFMINVDICFDKSIVLFFCWKSTESVLILILFTNNIWCWHKNQIKYTLKWSKLYKSNSSAIFEISGVSKAI